MSDTIFNVIAYSFIGLGTLVTVFFVIMLFIEDFKK